MPETFMVSLTFASGMDEDTEDVESRIREFLGEQQWQVVSLLVTPAN
jgi:menaquinone-dependent protoporphyrinogen IX oxidase